MQVKKQQLEPDMEQQTGSKLGKEFVKAVYCHPAYITYMQSTSREMPDWIKARKEKSVLKLQLVKQIVNRMSMVFILPGDCCCVFPGLVHMKRLLALYGCQQSGALTSK